MVAGDAQCDVAHQERGLAVDNIQLLLSDKRHQSRTDHRKRQGVLALERREHRGNTKDVALVTGTTRETRRKNRNRVASPLKLASERMDRGGDTIDDGGVAVGKQADAQ